MWFLLFLNKTNDIIGVQSTLLIQLWIFLGAFFVCIPLFYYFYMVRAAHGDWNITVDPDRGLPTISILVPTYNEERIINLKMDNLLLLEYPKELIEIIIIDSASNDNTSIKVKEYIARSPEYNIRLIEEEKRSGKSIALNKALLYVQNDIIAISDADCFWPRDILRKSIPYLSDETVGAVAGQEKVLNKSQSWVTKNEQVYKDKMKIFRLGESKLFSTIIFEGGFGLYKKKCFPGFDDETGADDSGTALKLVQKGMKTIIPPDIYFFTTFPSKWMDKLTIKIRRAGHLTRIWLKCLKYLINGELLLPKKIAIPEIFIHVFNPVIFLILIYLTVNVFLINIYFVIPFMLILLIPLTRFYFIEFIQNNFILLLSLIGVLLNKKIILWQKVDSSRDLISSNLLMKEGLL